MDSNKYLILNDIRRKVISYVTYYYLLRYVITVLTIDYHSSGAHKA